MSERRKVGSFFGSVVGLDDDETRAREGMDVVGCLVGRGDGVGSADVVAVGGDVGILVG